MKEIFLNSHMNFVNKENIDSENRLIIL
jgi:hypothetical protein